MITNVLAFRLLGKKFHLDFIIGSICKSKLAKVDIKAEFTHHRYCSTDELYSSATFKQRKYSARTGRNSTFENYFWSARIVYWNCLRDGLIYVHVCTYRHSKPSSQSITTCKYTCTNIVRNFFRYS